MSTIVSCLVHRGCLAVLLLSSVLPTIACSSLYPFGRELPSSCLSFDPGAITVGLDYWQKSFGSLAKVLTNSVQCCPIFQGSIFLWENRWRHYDLFIANFLLVKVV